MTAKADEVVAKQSRPCPLCGLSDRSRILVEEYYDPSRTGSLAFASRKLPEYMHHQLLCCADCDLVYASPAPTEETLLAAYHDADYDSSAESQAAARTYMKVVQRFAQRLPDRVGALDIGTGDGAFLAELLGAGFTNVVGVEPSAAPVATAAEHIRPHIRHTPFRAEDFSDQNFSLITCFQTMEHLYDPLQLCREACALLKEGGALLIVIHNRRAMSSRLLGRRSPIYDIQHLQLFSRPSGRLLLEKAGLSNVNVSFLFNCYRASYWMKLFPFPSAMKSKTIAAADALGVGRIPIMLPAGNLAIFGFKNPTATAH